MEDNLSQKRGWRRLKDGSVEDRQALADTLKAGKPCQCNICELEEKATYSAIVFGVCLLLAVLMIILFNPKAHASECVEGGSLSPGESCTSYMVIHY